MKLISDKAATMPRGGRKAWGSNPTLSANHGATWLKCLDNYQIVLLYRVPYLALQFVGFFAHFACWPYPGRFAKWRGRR